MYGAAVEHVAKAMYGYCVAIIFFHVGKKYGAWGKDWNLAVQLKFQIG